MPDTPPARTPTLSPSAKASLDAFLAATLAEGRHPAIHIGATNRDETMYLAQGGERVWGEPDKGDVDENTRLQLFSMTKLVTSVAVLQLVEAGKIDLDTEDILATHCPELVALPILQGVTDGEPSLAPRTQPLTVRRLLTHTSGLAYDFTSPLIGEYTAATGKPAHWASSVEGYTLPLVYEPGSSWKYSTGIDWAGILVERVSGKRLSSYFQDHIFGPLGLSERDIGFFPTPEVLDSLQQACTRLADPPYLKHTASPRSFDLDFVRDTAQLSGGGGLYGTAKAYLAFLRGVLAAQSPGGIISPESFRELFTDSLPPRGANTVHKGLAEMMAQGGSADPELVKNDAQGLGHSVGLLLNTEDSAFGRKKGSGAWSGLARTFYWLDPTTGIAGICFTQVLAPPPDPFTKVYNQFERLLYDGLAASA